MDDILKPIIEELNSLASTITDGWSNESTLQSAFGWACPPLTRHDLGRIPQHLALRMKDATLNTTDSDYLAVLQTLTSKIADLSVLAPYLYNGNCAQACSALFNTMDYVHSILEPILNWQVVDPKSMPNHIAKRIRSLQFEIDELIPGKEELKTQIGLIQDATRAAESLPTDMQALKAARDTVASVEKRADEQITKIDLQTQEAIQATISIKSRDKDAEKIVDKCNEVYRLATSTGLGGAFDYRATKLNQSLWYWVGGLIVSLLVGGWLAASRYESISKELDKSIANWGLIWVHIGLSLAGFTPIVWFAWLATKQISQRFRLSEDYAYKASVAKAYEGYRREAISIDERFQSELFASALSRLDEPPLRLVEQETHGSPFNELVNSQAFLKALDMFPELADKLGKQAKKINAKRKQLKPSLEEEGKG